jgi:hypothetical protein
MAISCVLLLLFVIPACTKRESRALPRPQQVMRMVRNCRAANPRLNSDASLYKSPPGR